MQSLTTDIKAITDEIASLDFIQEDFNLTAFNGGTVNSSYCLSSGSDKFFLKTFESDRVALLDRPALFRLQQELAECKLSPQPIYLAKQKNFQIDLWTNSPTLENAKLTNLEKITRLAEALALIHSIQITAPRLNLPEQWIHYEQIIGKTFISDDLRKEYSCLWSHHSDLYSTICHNDLALNHVTACEPAMIYDWEYCAFSSPYFDIASCIAINGLNKTEESILYAVYAQQTGQMLSDVVRKASGMKPLVELTNKLWYTAAAQFSIF